MDFCLAVIYTPAYGKENQAVLRLGWPRLPLPGWGGRDATRETRDIIEEYAAHGKVTRGILSGAPLPHRDILLGMTTVRPDAEGALADPMRLSDTQRTPSENWGAPALREAIW